MWHNRKGFIAYLENSGRIYNEKIKTLVEISHNNGNPTKEQNVREILYYSLVENEQKSILVVFPDTYKGWDKLKKECPYLSNQDILELEENHVTKDGAFYLKPILESVFIEDFL